MSVDTITCAEIGLNHDGDINTALRLIDEAKQCGVSAVKFQKRTIELVYSEQDLKKPKKTRFGSTYGAEKRGLEFEKEHYDVIDAHCKKVGMPWFASVWDIPSLEFILQYDVPWIKLPSCCNTNLDLLKAVNDSGAPSIMSTGMSTWLEVEKAAETLGPGMKYLLHATSIYPCPDNLVDLSSMHELLLRYMNVCHIGYSNHSPKIIYTVAAVAMGAKMVEFHVTYDRMAQGADHAASIGLVGMKRICDHIESLKMGMGDGWKNPTDEELAKGRKYPWRKG